MPLHPASSIFAMSLTGDLGDITYVQKAGHRRTSFLKTWPNKVPTPKQKAQRNLFAAAVQAWQAETPERQATANAIAKHNRMPMAGYNLYLSCYINQRMDWLAHWAQLQGLPW